MEALLGNAFVKRGEEKTFSLSDILKPDVKAVGLYFSAHVSFNERRKVGGLLASNREIRGRCIDSLATSVAARGERFFVKGMKADDAPTNSGALHAEKQGFTPQLAKFYEANLRAKGLEIIFVSSDKDDAAFKGYLGEMPWFALPFADRDRKNKLSAKFKVQGIPSFVILDTNGDLITLDGRANVMRDSVGNELPWRPKPLTDVLSSANLLTKDGSTRSFVDATRNCDVVGLYFSASWCGPCHRFTPILAECYKKLKQQDVDAKRNQRFEVVFLSSDRDKGAFTKYYGDMPWLALDFANQELKESLEERFSVEGIPTLVLIDAKTGATISEEGVGAIMNDPAGENFPWAPKPVEILDPSTAGAIGPTPALFIFCDDNKKAKELQADLIGAVDVWRGKAEQGAVCHGDVCLPTGGKLAGTEDTLFFVCGDHPIVARVRDLAKAQGKVVAMLDLSGPVYAHADIASIADVTPMAIRKFLQAYYEGKVQKIKVSQM